MEAGRKGWYCPGRKDECFRTPSLPHWWFLVDVPSVVLKRGPGGLAKSGDEASSTLLWSH